MKQHYVTFYSPGSFFNETDTRKIKSWDVKEAIKLSKKISQRYGAKPYGFKFETRLEADDIIVQGHKLKIEPKTLKESGLHWITGTVKTLADIPNTKENRILRDNMKFNNYKVVVENNNSYKYTGFLGKEDVVLNRVGNVIAKGSDFE